MTELEYFTNTRFLILIYLYKIRDRENRANITQKEIGDKIGISRITANKIIGELRDNGYIKTDANHLGRYIITDKAKSVLNTFLSPDWPETISDGLDNRH